MAILFDITEFARAMGIIDQAPTYLNPTTFLKNIDAFRASRKYKTTYQHEFALLKTHEDRVAFCAKKPEIQALVDQYIRDRTTGAVDEKRQKSAKEARRLHSEGKEYYESGRADETEEADEELMLLAVSFFNHALSYAPRIGLDGKDANDASKNESHAADTTPDAFLLPLIYDDRSIVFYQLGYYKECIQDIDCALEAGYAKFDSPEISSTLLKLRKHLCLEKLGRPKEAQEILDSLRDSREKLNQKTKESDKEMEKKVSLSKTEESSESQMQIESIKDAITVAQETAIEALTLAKEYQPYEVLPSLSAKVGLRINPKDPKHIQLIAKENINSLEIVHVAKPFSCALYPEAELKYCHHCARLLHDGGKFGHRAIPCNQCAGILYCSEECRLASWSTYHRYDCKLRLICDHPHVALVLRSLFITGLEKVREIATRTGPLSTEITDWEDYALLYQLDDYVKNKTLDKLVGDSIYACLLTRLCKMSGFLPGNVKNAKESQELDKLIGSVLLRHLLQMDYVAKQVVNGSTKVAFEISLIQRMLEYSCDENLDREFEKFSKCGILTLGVFNAMHTIPAGTLLTIAPFGKRQKGFTVWERKERQRMFRDSLERDCVCDRCELELRDSPKPEGTPYYPLRCPAFVDKEQCTGLITKRTGEFKCETCGSKKNVGEINKKYAIIEELFTKIKSLIRSIERTLPQTLVPVDPEDPLYKPLLPLISQVYTITTGNLAKVLHVTAHKMVDLLQLCGTYYGQFGMEDYAFEAQERILDAMQRLHGVDSSHVRTFLSNEMHPIVMELVDKLLTKKIAATDEQKNLHLFMRVSEFYANLKKFDLPYDESEISRLASRLDSEQ